jgi:hypothetical protein
MEGRQVVRPPGRSVLRLISRRRLVAIGVLSSLALSALAGVGCESDEAGDRARALPPQVDHPVADAIERLQDALARNDHAGVCAGLTSAAARQAGEAGHGTPTTCPRDVRRLFGMIDKGGGWLEDAPRVVDVEVDGRLATATVALDPQREARVPMRRVGDDWRLSGAFGMTPEQSRPIARAAATTDSFPPAGPRPVTVSDRDGNPCPALSAKGYPKPSGGCRLTVEGPKMPIEILTAFGSFRFDECPISYGVRIDSSGRTWIDDLQVEAPPDSPGCGDINRCLDIKARRLTPWRGRLSADGSDSVIHRSAVCIMTCVGDFVGDLTVRLTRDGDGWHAEPLDNAGDSGFQFDSPLRVDGTVRISAEDP